MNLANENKAMWLQDDLAFCDRQLFVHNLGVLLSQTREDVVSAALDDREIVTVTFDNGYKKEINVNMDSYLAIVRDVAKYID